MMVNIPLLSAFYVKLSLSQLFHDSLSYFTIIFLSLMTALALPTKRYFFAKESIDIKLGLYSKASILFMQTTLSIVALFGTIIPVLQDIINLHFIELFNFEVLKQSIIICTALLIGTLYMTNRKDTNPISLTEAMADIFFSLYANWLNIRGQKEESKEPWAIENLEKQTTSKFKALHTQQSAIFIVFTIFIVMLMVLTTSI
jgi:hypothetical protein